MLFKWSFKEQKEIGEYSIYYWIQNYETPAYTFGFVLGNFNQVLKKYRDIKVISLGETYSSSQLTEIFEESASIISFFEEKSGVDFYQPTYTQILIGNYYQEMSGLSILKHSYGYLVLKDSTETNLISHELAHQWWGNRIRSESLNHFWLNEAMATFMSAAYNEFRFGKKKYHENIESYYNVYLDIKERGNDKPLVFENWLNPSRDDRNLVYFKGAYFLHLLREKVGDKNFWAFIKNYSLSYFDKSVNSKDFQTSLEQVTGENLDTLFNEWVFGE
ncbi:MAG: hypothetical protein BalsKO_06430 [Balneolaceae bacterium]